MASASSASATSAPAAWASPWASCHSTRRVAACTRRAPCRSCSTSALIARSCSTTRCISAGSTNGCVGRNTTTLSKRSCPRCRRAGLTCCCNGRTSPATTRPGCWSATATASAPSTTTSRARPRSRSAHCSPHSPRRAGRWLRSASPSLAPGPRGAASPACWPTAWRRQGSTRRRRGLRSTWWTWMAFWSRACPACCRSSSGSPSPGAPSRTGGYMPHIPPQRNW